MKKNNSRETFGVNIGTSSLLLVFVIMCLVSFATLSTVSATADKKLNQKIIDRTSAYYDACNQAEEKLAGIDLTLKNLYESGLSRDEYYEQAGENIIFALPVSEVQTLNVNLKVNYPSDANDTFYSIQEWSLVTTGTLEDDTDNGLNLLF